MPAFQPPPAAAPPPAAPPPSPWSIPSAAPQWSTPSAAPESTDADLAAGARAAAQPEMPAPSVPGWQGSNGSDVAATMVAPPPADAGRGEGEPTTLMPAWQPPPAAPPPAAPPPVAETMAMPTRPPAAPSAGPQGEITIESGPDAGHTHRAGDHAVRMGRSPDNDVILRDPATSGHHARLERRGEQFWVVDLGSTNGTFVNGESIQEKQLNHGDRVTIGQNSLHFSLIGA